MQPLFTQKIPYSGQQTSPKVIGLIHGLFGSGDNFHQLGKALSDHFQVYLIDAPNHGRSPRLDSMDYQRQAELVLFTLDTLHIKRCGLVGHSMGGKIAMACALIAPERIEKLVVADMSPVHYKAHDHESEFAALKAVDLTTITSRREADQQMAFYIDNPQVRQFLLKSLVKNDLQWHWQFAVDYLEKHYPSIIDWPFYCEQYQNPVLILKGQLSDYIQSAYQSAFSTHFTQLDFKVIAQAGHWLHAEKPQLFNRLVYKFFAAEN